MFRLVSTRIVPLTTVLVLSALSLSRAAQQFPKDPLKNVTGEHVTGEFMELRQPPSELLHSGIDVSRQAGDVVYPPIPDDVRCLVLDPVGSDYVALEAVGRQGGQGICFMALHIDPSVQAGQEIDRNTPIGTMQGEHLHAEIRMANGGEYDYVDAVNPRNEAFEDVSDWTKDTINPTITGYAIHQDGTTFTWEIHAHDQVDADPSVWNGIYSMTLFVNRIPVKRFEFDEMSGSASDYYYCLADTCHPNNQSDYRYKFEWTAPDLSDRVWRGRLCDGVGHCLDFEPEDPTVAPSAVMTGEIGGNELRLRWTVYAISRVS